MTTDSMEEWACSSNEALELRFVRSHAETAWLEQCALARRSVVGKGKQVQKGKAADDDDEEEEEEATELDLIEPFQPKFTYPIFGDKETIFGYKGLKIELAFSSSSLKQYLDITYDSRIASKASSSKSGNTSDLADDLEKKLYEFIPPDYTKNEDTFQKTVEDDARTFRPFGKLVSRYAIPGAGELDAEYEIYHCTFATPGFREYHRRMQIFILLYIEAGSYIQEDEASWEFLVLYEKRIVPSAGKSSKNAEISYHFAGYVSVYPFWCYPEHVRLRLSQFVITPPYQSQGHGSQLYNALYAYALSLPTCLELTIEDPSEQFEDLRDRNDLKRLMQPGGLADSEQIKRGPPVDKAWLEQARREGKYAKRQFERLIEMLLLRNIDLQNRKAAQAYRLQVKERLYRFNYQLLCQVEKEERKKKLQETYESVEESYIDMLERVAQGGGFRWEQRPL